MGGYYVRASEMAGGGVETPPFILFLENGIWKRRNNDRVEIMEKNKEL